MDPKLTFFATTPKGMAGLLADELRALGAEDVAESMAGCAFAGALAQAYGACLWSRLANRVLLPLATFAAPTPEALYDGVLGIDWSAHLDCAGTLAVDFTTSRSAVTHTHYGALKVKDAVVDQFRARCGERPSVDRERPQVRINVYLHRDQATVSVDLSGESLHRRGYRLDQGEAPLKENLAAAILLRAGWPAIARAGGALVDPMCGAATLPVEAALMAADIAPGLLREYYGFLGWGGHQPQVWAALFAAAQQRRTQGLAQLPAIVGYDADPRVVRAALANVERAGLRGHVHIERRELAQCTPPPGPAGLVVANPPYGERLGQADQLVPLYAGLGHMLKERFDGWRASVFTGNPELGKATGLRARRKHSLYNGAIECRLLHFEVTPAWYWRAPAPRAAAPAVAVGPGGDMFANRLRKNCKHLERWARREGIACYRVYGADMPEYNLAIDLYHGERLWAHVQEYQAPRSVDAVKADARLREALAVIPQVLAIPREQLFYKVRQRQKGKAQYEKLAMQGAFHEVQEGGLRFLVNFTDYVDTGLFLDHRLTRALLSRLAHGRHFLNLFAYTGTATVYAAAGGATTTTTVDMSNPHLDWARRNLALNGYGDTRHHYIQADCLTWLAQAASQRERYGLIFLDPPTFSNSARMAQPFDVQRDHVTLITQAADLLMPGGVLIFSTNCRGFKLKREALGKFDCEDITRQTIPEDYARSPKIHQCWRIAWLKGP